MKKGMRYFVLAVLLGLSFGVDAQSEVEWVVEPTLEFDWVHPFSEGLSVVKLNDKYGCVNKKGRIVIPIVYDYVEDFSENFAQIGKDCKGIKNCKKWGFIDKTGKEITPIIYDYVEDFAEGFAQVRRNGKCGFIDKTGKEIVPIIYGYVEGFSEGFAQVRRNEKYGFIDKTGKEITPIIYEYIENFSEGLAKVCYEGNKPGDVGKCGYINEKGKVVIPMVYNYSYSEGSFSEGLAAICKEKCGYINKKGEVVIPLIYGFGGDFSEGRTWVSTHIGLYDNNYGYINNKGQEITPMIYNWGEKFPFNFIEGVAVVKVEKDNRYGLIDKTGKEIIPLIYDYVYNYPDLGVEIVKDGKSSFIDRIGKKVHPTIINYSIELKKSCKNNKCGYTDWLGQEVIPLIYDDVLWKFSEDLTWVKINGKWGIIRHPYYNKQPKINFPNLNSTINLTNAIKLDFKVCVQSSSDVQQTEVFINGRKYKHRGFGKGKDSDVCTKTYKYSIPVTGKGNYEIKVVSSNEYGTTTERRLVQVIKNYDKAVKIPKVKNHAVFIGIDNYTNWSNLSTPVKDCKALIEVLTDDYNFKADNIHTFYNEQATRSDILGFLKNLTEALNENDNLLVYYAGHGYYNQRFDDGYWIPYDAPKEMNEFEFIQDSDIKKILCTSDIRNVYVITDACYSGSFFDDKRMVRTDPFTDDIEDFLQKTTSFRGFASGGIETVADVSANNPDHSPFADALITVLKEYEYPALPAMILENHVLFKVQPSTTQTPKADYLKACEDSRGENVGQFVFYRKK